MTIRFSHDGPEFPGELVDSLLAGDVVFLCGTGISAPQLPDFKSLVVCIYEKLGVKKTDSEKRAFEDARFEEVLGSLSRRLVDPNAVTRAVSELLSVPKNPDLEQHRTILRLSRDLDNRFCVVTTNFDTLLERAVVEMPGNATPSEVSYAGQTLSAPGSPSFAGIVHVHGRLKDGEVGLTQSSLVLTSADYGDAYMRSGWASRFLFDLARCKVIVLVGYSANDAPVRYFLNVLEADRARFPDLKSVYAFDGYEQEPQEATIPWRTLAVTPLPYCKVSTDTGRHDHVPLWRDLTALADVVECPKHSRRTRARAILERTLVDASHESRREIAWLFHGRRDLWSVAINAIVDPEWFKFLQDEDLWSTEDCVWVVAAWISKDFQNGERFECAREWQERLGRPFTKKVGKRLSHAKGLDKTWIRVWRLFCLGEPIRRHDLAYYETRKRLASGVVLDSDLLQAVSLLAPKLVLTRRHRDAREEDGRGPIRKIGDLVWARMVISDRHSAEEVVDALRAMPDHAIRILELASSELQAALALEVELDQIGEEHDFNDSSVPSIESHEQNQYREGVNFLVRVAAECLPQAAARDCQGTRRLVMGWKGLPGRIGLRLCLHAMRNRELFDADEGMSILLSVSEVNFWLMRRELALLLRDRAGSASPEMLRRVEERITEGGDAYYNRFAIAQGESDWRAHARDAAVWLRLKMLQDAGALSGIGAAELSAIAKRREYLDREVEERDFFDTYSFGVRRIVGDPEPIVKAHEDDRLRVAHGLADSPDSNFQQGWSAFCRSDPQGAFDSLSKSDLTPVNGVLWNQFLGGLAFGDEGTKSVREDLAVRALDHLCEVNAESLQTMQSGLCEVILSAPRERVRNVECWLQKLWQATVQQPEESLDFAGELYERAINTSAGKLAQTLLMEIDTRRTSGEQVPEALFGLLGAISDCEHPAGQLGRGIFSHYVAFLLTVRRQYFVETFGPRLNAENDEGAALRAVLVQFGSITPAVTTVFGEAVLKGVHESKSSGHHAASIASNILRPALADLQGDDTVQWGLKASEVAGALRSARPAIRCGALEVLARWVQNDEAGVEEAWRVTVVPFFERVWPKEREFRDASFTPHLIDLAVGGGCKFPMALEYLRPYICSYDRGHGSLHGIAQSDVPERFPRETLELIWLACGPKSRGNFYEIPEIIDRLINADPDIEIDRRLQWLEQHAERYD